MLPERIKNMKCLVISDSHGNESNILKALSMHRDAEVVFFLGDGLSDADSVASLDKSKMWIAVQGNCDFRQYFLGREVKKTEEITLEGRRIVLTHGDLYGVKYGNDGIKNLALSRKADIVLFGHTHTPYEEYANEVKPIYLFNPGSISSPSYSFGILTVTEAVIMFSHGKVF